MSWEIKKRHKDILASEEGSFIKDPGGKIKIAMIWPGYYKTGMSALGYLAIYSYLNQYPNVLAERFFLPDEELEQIYLKNSEPLLSLENSQPLQSFDLLISSLSLENDYWHLLKILRLGGLSYHRQKRNLNDPPLLVGGVAVWANPWPLMPFFDLLLAGEAEEQIKPLIDAFTEAAYLPKQELLQFMAKRIPGAFYPEEKTLSDFINSENFNEPLITPAYLKQPFKAQPPTSPIITINSEFSKTKLVEISRGCPYGCRFCLAGSLFRPHRPWPIEQILTALGTPHNDEKIGLVSPAIADHPQIQELIETLINQGRLVSLSSLRLTAINSELAEAFVKGKIKGVAIAPEGASQRLRSVINKNTTEEEILTAVEILAKAGVQRIKLYFMIGLPSETDEDLKEMVELCQKIRLVAKKGKALPELLVSAANFTPKAHTAFEDAKMDTENELKRKIELLKKGLKKISRLSLKTDPPLWAIAQGILARGGPESSALVEAMENYSGHLRKSLKAINYSSGHAIHKAKGLRPYWRIVNPAPGFDYLEKEKILSVKEKISAPCPKNNYCGRCGAC